FQVSIGLGSLELSTSSTGTGAPDGLLGVPGVLASLATVADLALERMTDASRPAVGGSRATTRLVLAIVAAACVALKFLLNVHFDLFGFGFWAAAVLATVLVVFARRLASEPGPRPNGDGDMNAP